jgi:hypothetical protein
VAAQQSSWVQPQSAREMARGYRSAPARGRQRLRPRSPAAPSSADAGITATAAAHVDRGQSEQDGGTYGRQPLRSSRTRSSSGLYKLVAFRTIVVTAPTRPHRRRITLSPRPTRSGSTAQWCLLFLSAVTGRQDLQLNALDLAPVRYSSVRLASGGTSVQCWPYQPPSRANIQHRHRCILGRRCGGRTGGGRQPSGTSAGTAACR